uniref:Uncharacterized protein n=1 Tax=Arundo donax TaxID=35708 RepID=A0A0A9GR64_ARUDO
MIRAQAVQGLAAAPFVAACCYCCCSCSLALFLLCTNRPQHTTLWEEDGGGWK